jgi:hypothetical protein
LQLRRLSAWAGGAGAVERDTGHQDGGKCCQHD